MSSSFKAPSRQGARRLEHQVRQNAMDMSMLSCNPTNSASAFRAERSSRLLANNHMLHATHTKNSA